MRFIRVLVVHDATIDPEDCFAALRQRFIVRNATSIAEASRIVGSVDIGCVVGIVGRSIDARALSDAFSERLVYLRSPDTSPDDDLFLLTDSRSWLADGTSAETLVDRVSRTVATRE